MGTDAIAPFADNWAYLKTELNWLDRVLMMAVARQRQETKAVDRVSQSAADRVTHHWWQGIVTLNCQPAYDEIRKAASNTNTANKVGYQRLLEARIKATHEQGICLALPTLCEQLQLSLFEKNLILLALAPEVNRKYGQLYSYLNRQAEETAVELPTVDLGLRLLCRNDNEWRRCWAYLTSPGSLFQYGILERLESAGRTLLSSYLKVSDQALQCLMAETTDRATMQSLFTAVTHPEPTAGDWITSQATWGELSLPSGVKQRLQALVPLPGDGAEASPGAATLPGQLILLAGLPGSGKTLAASLLAQSQGTPLYYLDLKELDTDHQVHVLPALLRLEAPVMLIQSAHLWFGRQTALPAAALHHWIAQRRQVPGFTCLGVSFLQTMRPSWRQLVDETFIFPDSYNKSRIKK